MKSWAYHAWVVRLTATDLYGELIDIGAVVGALGAIGGVAGFLAATAAKTLRPEHPIAHGEWVAYAAGLAGTAAPFFEVFERAGL